MTARIIYKGGLRTVCTHVQSGEDIITDAPTDNFGKGEAFSPTDLLATSLATCMLTTMGIKAAKEGIPFNLAEAEMTKVMTDYPRRVAEIVVSVKVPREKLTDAQVKMLEQAAINCPVAKSLSAEVKQHIDFVYF